MSESLMRQLTELPPAEPDPARADRIKRRCRAQFVRRASPASRSSSAMSRFKSAQLLRPLGALLGVVYMTEVILQALRVYYIP